MVYRLRNKNLLYTIDGFKNRYAYKRLHDYIDIDHKNTSFLNTPLDHLSFIRTIQNYRNISRNVKPYFYGDKNLEQKFILYLKKYFRIPMTCETPVKLMGNARRRFAD